MADIFSTAAAVLGVIELAAKLASVCLEYTRSVKDAKRDILRLHATLKQLQSTFEAAKQRCSEMDDKLATTRDILQTSEDCFDHLDTLLNKLRVSTGKKLAAKLGRLKWPLQTKEIDDEIKELDRYCQRLQLAIHVDTITLIDDIGKDNILSKLSWADGATYDAFEDSDESNALCLEDTRVDLFKKIREWIANPESKSLFWLNGMAGTGKSTISRTLAKELAQNEQLGASFFFKEGEGDRGSAKRFFTTIAAQLARSVPLVVPHLRKALEVDPYIGSKAIKEQFEKLIFKPLAKVREQVSRPVVIVIDALDECKPDIQVEIILSLVSRLHELKPLHVRGFFTSRPERIPREGFQHMTASIYQDLILHEISESVIKHDIAVFVRYKFTELCNRREDLPADWPGESTLSTLTEKSQPLFIYAATICRFISTGRDPTSRLRAILHDEDDQAYDKIHQTYQPILDRLIEESTEMERLGMLLDFRQIVGPIVVVFDPLTMDALAALLDIDPTKIKLRLEGLHSLLNIPMQPDAPVRPLHLSFPNFLLDNKRRGTHRFWLDAREIHKDLASKCLDLLLKTDCLSGPDICNLKMPGYLRRDVDRSLINEKLPLEVQYACRYWTHHLSEGHCEPTNFELSIYNFLTQRFLFWFEALSILGRTSEMIGMLSHLSVLSEKSESLALTPIIYDAKRFVLANSYIANIAPLQLYSACIISTPSHSIIRKTHSVPSWLGKVPKAPDAWIAVQQTLISHAKGVNSVVYAQNGSVLASGSNDEIIKLWDPITGQLLQSLKGHSGAVRSIVISSDCKLLASGAGDRTIKLWNLDTGELQQTLQGHRSSVISVAFCPTDMLLASGSSDSTIKLWLMKSQEELLTLQEHKGAVNSVAFSPDGKFLASGSFDHTIRIWEIGSKSSRYVLEGHRSLVTSVAFSHDGGILVSASGDKTIKLWSTTSAQLLQSLEEHMDIVNFVTFSPDGTMFASGSLDQTIRIWDVISLPPRLLQIFEGHSSSVKSVAFSPDGKVLASGSLDETLKLWDLSSIHYLYPPPQTTRKHSNYITSMAFAPSGELLASGSSEGMINIWDISSEHLSLSFTLPEHSNLITYMAFSHNGELLASSSYDGTIKLWDMTSRGLKESIPCKGFARNLAFHNTLPRLISSIGSFDIQTNMTDLPPKVTRKANIKEYKDWLTINGQKLLWLPPEYQGMSIVYEGVSTAQYEQIAIGTSDGRVLIFQILADEVSRAGLLNPFEEIYPSNSEGSMSD